MEQEQKKRRENVAADVVDQQANDAVHTLRDAYALNLPEIPPMDDVT